MPAQTALPRWRGFNLTERMGVRSRDTFREQDFHLISELGFDFVRLPLCYRLWVRNPDDPEDLASVDEAALDPVDRAVEWGRTCGLHVCLNLHRAPGYSVNRDWPEKRSLWKSEKPLPAFKFHWEMLARRYRGVPSERLSFNLLNEPPRAQPQPPDEPEAWVMTRSDHERVMRATVEAIRAVDPGRLILLDGVDYANAPCPELADLAPGVAQSCRAYWPSGISHWKADWWKGSDTWSEPAWPGALHDGKPWDRARLEAHYAPWIDLARRGVGVHCGEGGAYNRTPHAVVLAWLRDALEILTAAGIGWALWNFRGSFGILDSERADAHYEPWHGHRLDRELLALLQEF